jgi:ATP-dependent exoDNAse (exonuclease V) beta subunit
VSPGAAASAIKVDKDIDLGSRLPFDDGTDMRSLGDALHQFFAVDDYAASSAERLRRAAVIAESHKIAGLSPASFVEASTRINAAIEELYPDAVWLREWSVTGRYGSQRMSGAIDLLLELSEGYVIIDHKSFPGPHDMWFERALSHYPQLDAYAQLVRQATGKEVIACYIHMPIVGALLSLKAIGPVLAERLPSLEDKSWLVF